MNKLLSLLIFSMIGLSVAAQVPKMMNYQGVARDASGKVLQAQPIDLRISIIGSDDINRPVYSEMQSVQTNSFGLFSLKIGSGDVVYGSIEEVDWSKGDFFISTEMDATGSGEFVFMGTSELLSVPYAFYAERSGVAETTVDGSGSRDIPFGGTNGQTIRHDGSNWVASSALYNDGSNVGIGTTSPSQELDVSGDINMATGGALYIGGDKILAVPGTSNVHFGKNTGPSSSGSYNVLIGDQAGENIGSGSYNMFLGYRSGRAMTTGSRNLMLGYGAGLSGISGDDNTYVGQFSGALGTTASDNVFIGSRAGYSNSEGTRNVAIGKEAGRNLTVSNYNSLIGYRAGYNTTTGINNSMIGYAAGFTNTISSNNSFVGMFSGYNSTGSNNTFIGQRAGIDNTSGSYNTYIGSNATGSASLTNAMAIGANASVTGDSSIVLGDNAKVGIGNTAPGYDLDVTGDINFTGTLYDNGVPFSGGGGSGGWTNTGSDVYLTNSSHQVGVGNSSPTSALDVTGTVTATGLKLPTGAVDEYILQTDASGNASWTSGETATGWRRADNTTVYNTGDSVGINTNDPLDKLHIMGSTTRSSITLTPNEPFSGDDATVILTEDDDGTYHMEMTYDGGDNRMYWYGKNNANLNGPHVGINRDNGRVGIGTGTVNPVSELEVVGTVTATAFDAGDASGLSNVYADSLRGSMSADTNDLLQWNGAYWNRIPYGRYAFHASASTDQTVGDTAYDTLRCNNSSSGENFEEPAGVYDNGTYAFEAPVDGIYFFEAATLWDNTTMAEVRNAIFIRVNNTDEVGEWSASGGTDFFGTAVSTTLELNAGDEVRVRIYNGDTTNDMDTFSQSGKYCYFSGYLVFAQ